MGSRGRIHARHRHSGRHDHRRDWRAAFSGDVAIDGGRMTAIGGKAGAGRREIDASGLLAAPGWVDIHTHYDGQVAWDPVPHAVELERRHDGGDGQLRRRLRAGAPRQGRLPDKPDGRRGGHPQPKPSRPESSSDGRPSASISMRCHGSGARSISARMCRIAPCAPM